MLLLKIEQWIGEFYSYLKSRFKKPIPDKLCTVTFIYSAKGIIGGGKDKTDTVFAWIADATTKHDCVFLFNPPGIGKGQCTIKEVIVVPIATVKPKSEDE